MDSQSLSKSNIVALCFVAGFLGLLSLAWTLDLPKRPILYYGSVFVGPALFVVMGVLRSWTMTLFHVAVLIGSGLFIYINFNGAMTIQKQMTFNWPPLLLGLFILFFFVHLRPQKNAQK